MAISPGFPTSPLTSWVGLQMQVDNERALKGVQEGKLNRSEFLDISSRMNDITELGNSLGGDCMSQQHRQQIALRQQALRNQLGAYEKGEFQLPNVPTGLIAEAQGKQSSQIFDGLKEGTISRIEGQNLMIGVQSTANGALPVRAVELMLTTNQSQIELARSSRENNPRQTSICPSPSVMKGLGAWAAPGSRPTP